MSAKGTPWRKLHSQLREHPKGYDLAEALDVEHVQAIGHLSLLWCWSTDYRPDGCLAGVSARQIEAVSEWRGERGKFVQAMTETEWLNADDMGTFSLHNAMDYAEGYKRAIKAQNQRSRIDTVSPHVPTRVSPQLSGSRTEREQRERENRPRDATGPKPGADPHAPPMKPGRLSFSEIIKDGEQRWARLPKHQERVRLTSMAPLDAQLWRAAAKYTDENTPQHPWSYALWALGEQPWREKGKHGTKAEEKPKRPGGLTESDYRATKTTLAVLGSDLALGEPSREIMDALLEVLSPRQARRSVEAAVDDGAEGWAGALAWIKNEREESDA